MTSINVKFRASTLTRKEGVLYIQLIHNRKVKLITTRFKLLPKEWNHQTRSINVVALSSKRALDLQQIKIGLDIELQVLEKLVTLLESSGDYTLEELVNNYKTQALNGKLYSFMEHQIALLIKATRNKTAAIYGTTLRSFKTFRDIQDIEFERINNNLIKEYEVHLKNKGVKNNTISCYMRVLRSVYNKAVEKGLTSQSDPFK